MPGKIGMKYCPELLALPGAPGFGLLNNVIKVGEGGVLVDALDEVGLILCDE